MKRYAAHYIYLPDKGYLKQHVVEIDRHGVVRVFPLVEEIAGVEWFPGVICLEETGQAGWYAAFLYYPFDFKAMQPAAGTRRRRLL